VLHPGHARPAYLARPGHDLLALRGCPGWTSTSYNGLSVGGLSFIQCIYWLEASLGFYFAHPMRLSAMRVCFGEGYDIHVGMWEF
ncbi:hypothetical protein C7212DRAFT_153723, partial [Tuber magnatum]